MMPVDHALTGLDTLTLSDTLSHAYDGLPGYTQALLDCLSLPLTGKA
ncbi:MULTISPECIES: hypothetical protein [Pseudomonas]|nr:MULTISPECIES: hypothetical protein [Pseudomonas]HDS0978846.1 hypothetical protein [Pseudomonas putida]